jgi:hypothetical protein
VASEAVSNSATMNTRAYMACVTPMSRTRPALRSNPAVSCLGWPKSLTRSAPATLNRSVMVLVIWALSA